MFGKRGTAVLHAMILIVGLVVWTAGCGGGGGSNSFSSSPAPQPTTSNTSTGTNVSVQPADANGATPAKLTFSNVTQGGMTTLTMASTGLAPPAGFLVGNPALYFDLATTAVFSGTVSVCMNYTAITFVNSPRLFHYNGSAWVDVTTSVDTANHTVCGNVTSFSPFAIFQSATSPAITSAGSAAFTLGTVGSFTVTAIGFPTPALTEGGALPNGVTFTDNHDGTAKLSGTATATGNFPITITAHNGATPDTTQNFTLSVNQAPTITSVNSATFAVGAAGTFTVTATGFPAPTVSASGLPAGVTFNTATGVLSGMPSTSGTFPFIFTAHNGVGVDGIQDFTLTVTAATQATLTITGPSVVIYGATGTATVSGGSGTGAVSFNAGASTGCSVTGTTVSVTNASGTCTLVATKAGDDSYSPATSALSTVVLNKATPTIKILNGNTDVTGQTSTFTYNGGLQGLTATVTGAGSDSLSITSLTYDGSSIAPANVKVVNNAIASYNVVASYGGNNNYNSASASSSELINRATAVISVTGYRVTYDGQAHTATGTATGVESTPANLSSLFTLSGTTHTETGIYNGDAWTFSGNNNYNPANGTINDAISMAGSTMTVDCTAGAPYTYTGSPLTPCTAVAAGAGNLSVQLTPIYSNNINAGTASVTADYTGDANHSASTGGGSFVIGKATPTITWANPASITYGTALGGTQLNASAAGVLGSFAYTQPAGTLLNAGASQTLSATFTPNDTTNYTTQTATVTITVSKASSTVNVDCTAGAPFIYTGSPLTPCTAVATGAGNLSVQLTPSYSNNINAGTASVTADYTGDTNHSASTGSGGFVIGKATPTITWANPANITYGAALTSAQLNASASVPGNLTYTPAAGAVLSTGNQMLNGEVHPHRHVELPDRDQFGERQCDSGGADGDGAERCSHLWSSESGVQRNHHRPRQRRHAEHGERKSQPEHDSYTSLGRGQLCDHRHFGIAGGSQLYLHLRERHADSERRCVDCNGAERLACLWSSESNVYREHHRPRQRRYAERGERKSQPEHDGDTSFRSGQLCDHRQCGNADGNQLHLQLRTRHADGERGCVDSDSAERCAGVWGGEPHVQREYHRPRQRRHAERGERKSQPEHDSYTSLGRGQLCDHRHFGIAGG